MKHLKKFESIDSDKTIINPKKRIILKTNQFLKDVIGEIL